MTPRARTPGADGFRLRLHRPTHTLVWPLNPPREMGVTDLPRPRRPVAPVQTRVAAPVPPLRPSDPRWILAVRAWQLMQGDVVTATARREVIEAGRVLGLRDFESNLILAIVQDQARLREPLEGARGLVSMVPRRGGAGRNRALRVAVCAAAAVAIEAAALWVMWNSL